LHEVVLDHAAASVAVRGQVRIVTADDSHAAGLHRLVTEALANEERSWSGKPTFHPDEEVSIEDVQALIAAPRSRLFAALDGGVIVGCVLVTRNAGGRSTLGLLGVDSDCRRRGLGGKLIVAAEAIAAETFGSDQIELCVLDGRARLMAYYEKRGFRRTGERRVVRRRPQATMEFVVMGKLLGGSPVS
jgi:ribosomal protein S18 acetylase RimI-like enzyme